MSVVPADLTEGIEDNDYAIQCVIELEQERLGRKLKQEEIKKIINRFSTTTKEEVDSIY